MHSCPHQIIFTDTAGALKSYIFVLRPAVLNIKILFILLCIRLLTQTLH